MKEIIQKLYPEDLRTILGGFSIDDSVLSNHVELIQMICRSKSMDKKEEKQSRFDLLPVMNEDQVQKLYDILDKERSKLKEIQEKYEKRKGTIKDKYKEKRDETAYTHKITTIKNKEKETREQELEEADSLLEELDF